jgi:predicted GNAT family acetyltransferase
MQNFGKIGVKTGVKIHQFTEFFEKTYQHDMPENSWILSYLAVDRELHGKGIGRHLLSHVFTVADYHGQDCVTLCFDGHGVDFFLKVGFTLLKTIPEPIKKSSCPPAQILIRRPRVDIDHALSSLTLSHSSSSELNASQQSSNKDKKRHSKHAL